MRKCCARVLSDFECNVVRYYVVRCNIMRPLRKEMKLIFLLFPSAQRCLWHVLDILEFFFRKERVFPYLFCISVFCIFSAVYLCLYLLNLYLYTCLCVSLFLFCVFLSVFLCFCASGDVSLESWQRQPKSHHPTRFLFDLLFSICSSTTC